MFPIESRRNIKDWSKSDWDASSKEFDSICKELTSLLQKKFESNSKEVTAVIRRHYNWLKRFWTPTKESYAGHGQFIEERELSKAYERRATFSCHASSRKQCKHFLKKNSRAFLATFFLTLTNPMTIISFAAVYAGLGIGHDNSSVNGALITTLGVFLGSAIWWMILSLTNFLD
jgi:hypothetical protein